jgi:hypothetical protein
MTFRHGEFNSRPHGFFVGLSCPILQEPVEVSGYDTLSDTRGINQIDTARGKQIGLISLECFHTIVHIITKIPQLRWNYRASSGEKFEHLDRMSAAAYRGNLAGSTVRLLVQIQIVNDGLLVSSLFWPTRAVICSLMTLI